MVFAYEAKERCFTGAHVCSKLFSFSLFVSHQLLHCYHAVKFCVPVLLLPDVMSRSRLGMRAERRSVGWKHGCAASTPAFEPRLARGAQDSSSIKKMPPRASPRLSFFFRSTLGYDRQHTLFLQGKITYIST